MQCGKQPRACSSRASRPLHVAPRFIRGLGIELLLTDRLRSATTSNRASRRIDFVFRVPDLFLFRQWLDARVWVVTYVAIYLYIYMSFLSTREAPIDLCTILIPEIYLKLNWSCNVVPSCRCRCRCKKKEEGKFVGKREFSWYPRSETPLDKAEATIFLYLDRFKPMTFHDSGWPIQ